MPNYALDKGVRVAHPEVDRPTLVSLGIADQVPAVVLAEELHRALRADDPDALIDSFEVEERIVIDGKFDLLRVAKRIQNALREWPREVDKAQLRSV